MVLDATEAAAANFAQDRILAREVAEKRGLADFQDLNDIFDSGILVSAFAEQANRSVNDLLPQPRFFALAKAQCFFTTRLIDPGKPSLRH